MKLSKLFTPSKFANLKAKNKIAMPALHLGLATDGRPSEALLDFYEQRARGGAGIITVGVCNTWPEANNKLAGALELSRDSHVDSMAPLASQIKKHGAVAGVQIAPLIGYTDSTWTPDINLINDIVDSVGAAALRAQRAGFDFVELMLSGGSIFSQFLSQIQNRWEIPGYSGGWDERLRISLEAIESINKYTSYKLSVTVRIHGHEYLDNGYGIEGGIVVATAMERAKVAAVNVTGAGHRTSLPQITNQTPPLAFAYLARNVKGAIDVPVFFGGRLRTPEEATSALSASGADFVNIGRALIADPKWPQKAMESQHDNTVQCMACGLCFDQAFSKAPIRCSVNPQVGRVTFNYPKTNEAKLNVLVAGSGPAGLTAAWSYHSKGHAVRIRESSKHIGGKWRMISQLNQREDLHAPFEAFVKRLNIAKVPIETNAEVTPQVVRELAPDVLVLAVGARPRHINLPGIETHPNVMHANDVLASTEKVGANVVIIGAAGAGVELAVHLASEGLPSLSSLGFLARYGKKEWLEEALSFKPARKVTLLKRRGYAGSGLGRSVRWTMIQDLKRLGVKIIDKTEYKEITPNGVHILNLKTNENTFIKADTIITATGYSVPQNLIEQYSGTAPKIITVGDADHISNIGAAVSAGWQSTLK